PDNNPDDNDSPTHQQQDSPCWIFGNSGCQPSIQQACFAAGYSFALGGCVKHSEENYNKLIYFGTPTLRDANDDDDDNQGDDNQKQDNQGNDNAEKPTDKDDDDNIKGPPFSADDLLALSLLPPLTGDTGGGDDDTQNTANNNPTNQTPANGDDGQGEKWESPVDLNAAEFAAGIGNIATDVFGSLANKGRGVPNSEDSTLANALACRSPTCVHHIGNAEADGLITNAQANALKNAATGKAGNSIEINNPVLNNIRTGSALKKDELHAFNNIIDNYAGQATKFSLKGGDGVERSLYQVEGSLNGKSGVFEWIVDPNPAKGVVHRRFIENVPVTGKPNATPAKGK
ncbi:MAG: hypothetical protein IJM09_01380, partial [Neisseriaceae bacterium]|nr:hypothetical protein [Neisseriaceae bacterium]